MPMRANHMQLCGRVVTTVAGLAGSWCSASAQELVVKIGHVGPTSGPIAHLGKDNELGARMAIEELNSRHLCIGGKRAKFELLAEDDAADPKQGTAAAQKLVDSKVNGVVGHLNSGTSIPASTIYANAGIPQISPSATAVIYTGRGLKNTFRIVPNDGQLGNALGQFAVKDLKIRNIAVMDDRTVYGKGIADEFERGVKEAGGVIVGREFTNDKATDFTSALTSLKWKKPGAVFFGGMDSVAGPLIRQMKQMGVDAKFIGGDGICSRELPRLAAGVMSDGQVFCAEVGGSLNTEAKKSLDDFKKKFRVKFGAEVQIFSPYVYDAVNAMAEAMVQAGSADPVKYMPALAGIQHKGVTGDISFDCKGDIRYGAVSLYSYRGGSKEPLTTLSTFAKAGCIPSSSGYRFSYSSCGSGGGSSAVTPRPESPKGERAKPDWKNTGGRGEGEHRAQGDAAGSPVTVDAVVGSVSSATGGAFTPGGAAEGGGSNSDGSANSSSSGARTLAAVSRWGSGQKALRCIESLQGLRAKGRARDYIRAVKKAQITSEIEFAEACLDIPDRRIASRVGRLHDANGVTCTVTLLNSSMALTARHCFFSKPKLAGDEGIPATVSVDTDYLKSLHLEFGPLDRPVLATIDEILLPAALGWQSVGVQTGASGSSSTTKDFQLDNLDRLQSDFAVIRLSTAIESIGSRPIRHAEARAGEKIYMAAFYPGYGLSKRDNDDGLRQQVAGLCQILEVGTRCMVHGCTTNSRASGAAMFVEREGARGRKELRLVGIHTSGAIPDIYTKCPAKSEFSKIFNIGAKVQSDDLAGVK